MAKGTKLQSWVVYWTSLHGKPTGMTCVCEQTEWDALELSQPGRHTLIRKGITNEGEAEQFARSQPKGNAASA
jgi:hypothetical protein